MIVARTVRKITNAYAHGSCANGSGTFMPNIPKNTFGMAMNMVAAVRIFMVRFRLLLAMVE